MGIEDIPFYYFVFSSTDPMNVKIILQEVDESKSQNHIVAIENVIGKLQNDKFVARPTMQRCSKCPLNHKCESKVNFPLVDTIYY